MGCDIHAHVELKLADGKWHHWTTPYIQRNYALFEKLAGVRANNWITPIAPPRGMPDDVSTLTQVLYMSDRPGGHSHSWISRDEILDLEQWWAEHVNNLKFDQRNVFEVAVMGNYADGNGYGEDLPPWVKDVRLVFWFDN